MYSYKLFETNLDIFLLCYITYCDYYPSLAFYHPAEVFLSRLEHIDHSCVDLLSCVIFLSTRDMVHVMLYLDDVSFFVSGVEDARSGA
jgi:hypothetical protein